MKKLIPMIAFAIGVAQFGRAETKNCSEAIISVLKLLDAKSIDLPDTLLIIQCEQKTHTTEMTSEKYTTFGVTIYKEVARADNLLIIGVVEKATEKASILEDLTKSTEKLKPKKWGAGK